MQTISRDFKPVRYAKRDGRGNIANQDYRAEATKEYLEEEHWGLTETTRSQEQASERRKLAKQCQDILDKDKNKYSDVIFNTDSISLPELKEVMRTFKRGKAPGPDNITTDWVKYLKGQNLEDLRTLINHWWVSKQMPEDISLARLVSLYKERSPDMQENYRPISLLNTY